MAKKEDENIFNSMESSEAVDVEGESSEKTMDNNSDEVNYESMSNVAVGEKEKFERIDLDGKKVTISKAQLFNADTNEEPITALNDKSKQYYKCNFIIHYEADHIPDDKPQREYLSGAIQFVNKNGELSKHSLWYPGAKNQLADLWEKVAKKKGKKPEKLSPREFMGFLNSRPKAILEDRTYKFQGKEFHKNMVKKFI